MGAHGSERIAGAEAAPSLVLVPAGKDERQELCVGHEVLAGLERRYVHLHRQCETCHSCSAAVKRKR